MWQISKPPYTLVVVVQNKSDVLPSCLCVSICVICYLKNNIYLSNLDCRNIIPILFLVDLDSFTMMVDLSVLVILESVHVGVKEEQ